MLHAPAPAQHLTLQMRIGWRKVHSTCWCAAGAMRGAHLAEPGVCQDLLDILHLGQQPDGAAVKQLGLWRAHCSHYNSSCSSSGVVAVVMRIAAAAAAVHCGTPECILVRTTAHLVMCAFYMSLGVKMFCQCHACHGSAACTGSKALLAP